MDDIFERSTGLLGKFAFENIQEKTILIFGIGGVGSSAFESLARTGFRKFVLVDFDKVSPSNLNRQTLYCRDDIGKNKVDVAKKYIEKVNSDVEITTYNCTAQDFKFKENIDFVVDAIDDVEGKMYIAKVCSEKKIPLIVSLGMANRLDPSKVCVTKLNKTFNDPFAKKLRHFYKKSDIVLNNVNVVFSTEEPAQFNGKLNSIMTVPSAAGLNITCFVIQHFLKEE